MVKTNNERVMFDGDEARSGERAVVRREASPRAPGDEHLDELDKLATFGMVAAGLVHDLNNPLTAVLATAEYLLRRIPGGEGPQPPAALLDPAELREKLMRMREAALKARSMTDDLLSYVKPSEATFVFDPHQALERALDFCDHTLERVGARVERHYAKGDTYVSACEEHLVRIFVNVIANACHAVTASEGVIAVRTQIDTDAQGKRHLSMIVEDNGHGIAAETLPNVFRAFFTTKPRGEGTGLGLYVVHSLVAENKGDVRIESAVGRGTRIVFQFPLVSSSSSR
jgi:two-component system NtrC family sensor kinase